METGALETALQRLRAWLVEQDYAGYEPYDLLNSPRLAGWGRRQPFATLFVQGGKRFGGLALRRWLRVPACHNPKALALILSAYCELQKYGVDCRVEAGRVRDLLLSLRSPNEADYCWGYPWHYVSLRGVTMPPSSPNSVVTTFCAQALLDDLEVFGTAHSGEIAGSAAHWLNSRLNHTVDTGAHLCVSYTPDDQHRILNNNALIAALYARVDRTLGLPELGTQAHRMLCWVGANQEQDGSWPYGLARSQRWIDSFHTGFNVCAFVDYERYTGDRTFHPAVTRGYEFYRDTFFTGRGEARYFHNRTYPVDIHACSQAILTFSAFAENDEDALSRAQLIARWTLAHLRNDDGSFGFQVHRAYTDHTPYIRWSQAWMFLALSKLQNALVR